MTIATSANIALTTTPSYCTYAQWYAKYGISITDETEAQFAIDLREAHELVRRKCFHLVRERIVTKDTYDRIYLPKKFITDGNMDGSVDADDIVILELADNGLSFNSVDNATYIDTVYVYNNYIQLDTNHASDLTNQLFVVYHACSKPFDEVVSDELKRAVMAQTTMLVIERLRISWGLKGTMGWSAGGVSVNKDLTAYKELYTQASSELDKYIHFLRPAILRGVSTGQGLSSTSTGAPYASQFLYANRTANRVRRIW